MVRLINGDDGEIGLWLRNEPTGKDGWVNVIYQPVAESFIDVLKCLIKRPEEVIRNVPEDSILGPVLVGPPNKQKQVIFLTQGENQGRKLLDELGLLQNQKIDSLRQQLQDEIIKARAAQEEKSAALGGVKSALKSVEDLKPREKRKFHPRDRSWGDFPDEENY